MSFVANGYKVMLWTYGGLCNAPSGVEVRDGREILSEKAIFLNQQGSYAGFSDLFRYAVLRKLGGLYSDVDVLAMKSAEALPETPFLVTEYMRNGRTKINGNVIHSPQPLEGDVIDLAYAYACVFPKERVSWSEIGPSLLTAISGIYPEHGFVVKPPSFANPIAWWDCPARFLADEQVPECFFLHLYNEMWRRAGIDKNQTVKNNTMLGRALGI